MHITSDFFKTFVVYWIIIVGKYNLNFILKNEIVKEDFEYLKK